MKLSHCFFSLNNFQNRVSCHDWQYNRVYRLFDGMSCLIHMALVAPDDIFGCVKLLLFVVGINVLCKNFIYNKRRTDARPVQ